MQIAALSFRLAASSVLMTAHSRSAELVAVHSNDPDNPNASFSQGSAKVVFRVDITKPEAFDFLQPGEQYDLVMVPRGAYVISVQPVDVPISGADADDAPIVAANLPVAPEPVDLAPAEPIAPPVDAATTPAAPVDPVIAPPADPAPAADDAAERGAAPATDTRPAA